jgi:hypothetical protein
MQFAIDKSSRNQSQKENEQQKASHKQGPWKIGFATWIL